MADADKSELAEDRTDLAEDRTILANERTFAGWIRTGLAAVGLGLAFNALFGKIQPDWVPRAIASLFIVSGMLIFYLAQRNGYAVLNRLNSHRISPLAGMSMRLVALAVTIGACALLAAIWLMHTV